MIEGAGPIDLRAGNDRAILLLHGFGDTPQTLAYLARDLHANGYDVRVPLLPGHGRSIDVMDTTSHTEWIDTARAELIALRARHAWVALGGISMGGAIAAILAAEMRDLPSLVIIAPSLRMPARLRFLARAAPLWSDWRGPVRSTTSRSILDPAERALNLAYGVVTGRSLLQLSRIESAARRALRSVSAPTLFIQSKSDHRLPVGAARRAFERLGAKTKRLVLTDEGGHIITVDYGRERVFEEVRAWLRLVPEPRPSQGARTD